MFGKITQWNSAQTTQPTQDIGFGTAVLSAGDKTRVVVSLSSYSGTNSANGVTTKYMLIPSQVPDDAANNAYDSSTQFGSIVYQQTGNLASATSPITGFPMQSDRSGTQLIVVPPGYILVAFVADANANGTIIHQIVSGECEY